jgi:hypothetical protein
MLRLMADMLKLIWWAIIGLFRSRASLEAEIVALRHQLNREGLLRDATSSQIWDGERRAIARIEATRLVQFCPSSTRDQMVSCQV